MRGKKWVIVAAVVAAAILVLAGREPILLAIGDFLTVQDELEPADVIHVIAGSDYRTDHAIQLYKQGYSNVIFFTGGWCNIHGYYHGQHGAERAEAQGVDPERIAIDESPVTSTYDEAVVLKGFLARSPAAIRSVIVVSDPYHMRRVRWTYRKVLGDGVRVELAPVPLSATRYQRRWWVDPASREYVTNEYMKLVYYFARHQLELGPIGDWLASLDRE